MPFDTGEKSGDGNTIKTNHVRAIIFFFADAARSCLGRVGEESGAGMSNLAPSLSVKTVVWIYIEYMVMV
jgi:hypothetical protein